MKPTLKNISRWTVACVLLATAACNRSAQPPEPSFASPDEAVRALIKAAKAGPANEVLAIFGPDGRDLVDTTDPASARRNREVFVAAAAEHWQLVDQGNGSQVLVIGNERWPFPIPVVKSGNGWRFDTAAGKEEVIARRIGRNELMSIQICRTYVAAQRLYAKQGHDGKPAGIYAMRVRSDSGKENGLYWPLAHGKKRSPLGDLMAEAETHASGSDAAKPSPFYGYYFKILSAQGASAPGGAKNYVRNGDMSGGFALVAWPAAYDVTGVMTFLVNQDGVVRERDLGPETEALARAMTEYNPDQAWTKTQ
jgi:hypothetical protein